jgi:hypothetical protein
MPIEFEIKFQGVPALQCQLHDTIVAAKYFDLLKTQYKQDSNPIFRDPQKYTLEYFQSLVTQAQQVLGWNWQRDHYTLSVTTLLHKDIEQYLANGFENIPQEHDYLLRELHFCLHAIESGSRRNHWLQVEWFNDTGFSITEDEYPEKLFLEFGDLRLQNPYVGHHPLYLYEQQDSINITQTCRFHDFIKPGINIVIQNRSKTGYRSDAFDWDRYIKWFEVHASKFLDEHGIDRLRKFTGHPVVGSVLNLDDLYTLIKQPIITFEHIAY